VDVVDLPLSGLKLLRPRVFADARGSVCEVYQELRYRAVGITSTFVQLNHAHSLAGTLRGLHYQAQPGQAKLVRVTFGRTFHVALDIRRESPTFGAWYGTHLSDAQPTLLFLPIGFAHGFCVESEVADVEYQLSAPYDAEQERQIRWDDPELEIRWPLRDPVLSERDRQAETFAEFRSRLG
jgi:dTDP-4-dehydrorhamnose 3,5-epimerase